MKGPIDEVAVIDFDAPVLSAYEREIDGEVRWCVCNPLFVDLFMCENPAWEDRLNSHSTLESVKIEYGKPGSQP